MIAEAGYQSYYCLHSRAAIARQGLCQLWAAVAFMNVIRLQNHRKEVHVSETSASTRSLQLNFPNAILIHNFDFEDGDTNGHASVDLFEALPQHILCFFQRHVLLAVTVQYTMKTNAT